MDAAALSADDIFVVFEFVCVLDLCQETRADKSVSHSGRDKAWSGWTSASLPPCSGEELEWECKLALHVRVCVSLSLS